MKKRTYRIAWEKEFSWCRQFSLDRDKAFCVYCGSSIQPKKAALNAHERGARHKRCINEDVKPKDLPKDVASRVASKEETDLRLAAYALCHKNLRGINHLNDIIFRLSSSDVTLSKAKLDTGKVVDLACKVLSASFMEELKDELRGQEYSLFVDIMTDFGTRKVLCVVIRHLGRSGKMLDDLLGLVELEGLYGEALGVALSGLLNAHDLDILNCNSFAFDGASIVGGAEDSLWSIVKTSNPLCFQVRCISNSLALAVENSFKFTMPDRLYWLILQVTSYFNKPVIDERDYVGETAAVNAFHADRTADSFVKCDRSQWLVKYSTLNSLREHWFNLASYFSYLDRDLVAVEHRHTLDAIAEVMQDESNYLLLIFLCPITKDFERLNTMFQANGTSVGAERAYKSLRTTLHSLENRVKKSDSVHNESLPISEVDFGVHFTTTINKYVQQGASEANISSIRNRCWVFMIQLVEEIKIRLLENEELFRMVNMYNPEVVLGGDKPMLSRMSFIDNIKKEEIDEIEEQWRLFSQENWKEKEPFPSKEKSPTDILSFWFRVRNYAPNEYDDEDSGTKLPYAKLGDFVIGKLTMAHPSAAVERRFSALSSVKNRFRNGLSVKALDALFRIRSYLDIRKCCCADFNVTERMLQLYQQNIDLEEQTSEDNDDEIQAFDELIAFLPDGLQRTFH